ncbi:MAG: Hsp20 family protein [Rhodospirillales bacterium]|nr:Hsp20 family protein [Rhodospirillales bacterium]
MGSRFDYSPLFRSTIGFDRLMNLLETTARLDEASLGYPPYDIQKIDDSTYGITIAVAGFAEDDLHVETRENSLIVAGDRREDHKDRAFLHRGITGRAFRRTFQLADYVKVVGARLENGLLHIDLVREIPEEMKPRTIEISASGPAKIAAKAKKLVDKVKHAA